MKIERLEPEQESAWDEYVARMPDATFFHLSGWRKVLQGAFGHDTHFLYAREQDQIVGILPLGHVNSRLFSNALMSVPFCVYGGAVADREDIALALEAEAVRLGQQLGVDYVEFRNRLPRETGRPRSPLYVTFRRTLDPDPEKNLALIPRKQRAMIRKGIAAGLRAVIDDDVNRFYECYAESVRNLGTPVFSKGWFAMLKSTFGEQCEILVVEHQGKPVSAVMSLYFRDEVLPYYGGGGLQARELKANDFMYWDIMRRSAEKGIRTFDFGRSKEGTGSCRFKTHWGFTPEPLPYEFELVKLTRLPEINPLNPKYRIFIAAWKKLPLVLSKMLGPWLARSLG